MHGSPRVAVKASKGFTKMMLMTNRKYKNQGTRDILKSLNFPFFRTVAIGSFSFFSLLLFSNKKMKGSSFLVVWLMVRLFKDQNVWKVRFLKVFQWWFGVATGIEYGSQ